MPVFFYSLVVLATSVTALPPDATNECIAENGDNALSQQSFGAWTLFHAKCSCILSLPGPGDSSFDMLVVKATADQKVPRLSVMVSVTQEFPDDVEYFPVIINDKPIAAGAQPKAGVFLVELEGHVDWFNEVAKTGTISIGPYSFGSDQSDKAVSALQTCYAGLEGK
jgi:hypothetical protein